MEYYRIMRYFADGRRRRIAGTFTLEEAKRYCSRPDTSGVDSKGVKWFDGFTKGGKPRRNRA